MSNQLLALLGDWYSLRDRHDWVLGTVYRTEGPAYRKAGAMMLFSDQGHQLGMLSGGCLESDLHRRARQVMDAGKALTLSYDGSDEDDVAFRLGIGCGGVVHILLQPVNRANRYLMLDELYRALGRHQSGCYYQRLPGSDGEVAARFLATEAGGGRAPRPPAALLEEGGECWLCTPVAPPPHLLIVGGGVDARPLAALGHQLGWRISLWDPRPANGRPEYFPAADQLLGGAAATLGPYAREQGVLAAVLMSHNIRLDAEALRALADCRLGYLALLRPENRRSRVLAEAGLTPEALATPLAGPAGLDIRAELPEDIALSILAECQAVLHGGSGRSLSGVLAR